MHVLIKQTLLGTALTLATPPLFAGSDLGPAAVTSPTVGTTQHASPAHGEAAGTVTQVTNGSLFHVTVTDARGNALQIGDKITLHLKKHGNGFLPVKGSSLNFVPDKLQADHGWSVLNWSTPIPAIKPPTRGIEAHNAPIANQALGMITGIDADVYSIRVTDSRTKGLAIGDTIKARLEKGPNERLPALNDAISFVPGAQDQTRVWRLKSWELDL